VEFLESKRADPEDTGPWIQDIRIAWSSDALSFSPIDAAPAIEGGGVPEVYTDDAGTTWLYYIEGDIDAAIERAEAGSDWFATHGIGGYGALALASSTDGVTFSPVEEFGVAGLTPGMVVDPDVIAMPDGTWRMYYVVIPTYDILDPGIWDPRTPHRTFFATSTDLVHWEEEQQVVHGPYADPTVHCYGDGRCLMLSFGLDHCQSADGGESFVYLGPWEAIPGFAPELFELEDGTLRAFYNSMDKGAPLRSHVSTDGGATWEQEDGDRLDTYGEAATVTPAPGGGWYLYTHDFKEGTEPDFADW